MKYYPKLPASRFSRLYMAGEHPVFVLKKRQRPIRFLLLNEWTLTCQTGNRFYRTADFFTLDISNGGINSLFSKERLSLSTRTQILIYLAILAVLDAIIPIPITAMVLIMVLFRKPSWFKDWVDEVYRK